MTDDLTRVDEVVVQFDVDLSLLPSTEYLYEPGYSNKAQVLISNLSTITE